mgnify:CR=1 FL=1
MSYNSRKYLNFILLSKVVLVKRCFLDISCKTDLNFQTYLKVLCCCTWFEAIFFNTKLIDWVFIGYHKSTLPLNYFNWVFINYFAFCYPLFNWVSQIKEFGKYTQKAAYLFLWYMVSNMYKFNPTRDSTHQTFPKHIF